MAKLIGKWLTHQRTSLRNLAKKDEVWAKSFAKAACKDKNIIF
jgi:hypothetical protein